MIRHRSRRSGRAGAWTSLTASTPTGRAGRPTLKTIAYITGLGVTTVSRALNDAPDIGQATKERVRLVASQIGYRPNRAGVRLRTGKTNVISLILSIETEVLGLTSHVVYGISEYLAGSPYHLIVTPYNMRSDPLEPVRYIVETGSADGIIFSRTEPEDARVRYLHERGFPFASHGRTEMDIVHPYFDFDNARYAEIAVDRLAARGRRQLALLPPSPQLTYARHMTAGFLRGIERHDLVEMPVHGITTDSPPEAMRVEMARLMAARRRPDGHRLRQRRLGDLGDHRGGVRRPGHRARLRRGGEGILRSDAQVPPRDRGGARGLPRRRHGPRPRGRAHHRGRAGRRAADDRRARAGGGRRVSPPSRLRRNTPAISRTVSLESMV